MAEWWQRLHINRSTIAHEIGTCLWDNIFGFLKPVFLLHSIAITPIMPIVVEVVLHWVPSFETWSLRWKIASYKRSWSFENLSGQMSFFWHFRAPQCADPLRFPWSAWITIIAWFVNFGFCYRFIAKINCRKVELSQFYNFKNTY